MEGYCRTKGKSEHWHLRNLSITAKAAPNVAVHRTPEELLGRDPAGRARF
jgi:hypothetical protein